MTHFCGNCGQHYNHNCSQTKRVIQVSNFERTMDVLQKVLSNRLRSGYAKIWVQGSNKPNATVLLFTIFNDSGGYTMRSMSIRNFRQFRQENENVDEEMAFINRHIGSFETILNEFVDYGIQS